MDLPKLKLICMNACHPPVIFLIRSNTSINLLIKLTRWVIQISKKLYHFIKVTPCFFIPKIQQDQVHEFVLQLYLLHEIHEKLHRICANCAVSLISYIWGKISCTWLSWIILKVQTSCNIGKSTKNPTEIFYFSVLQLIGMFLYNTCVALNGNR